MMNLWINGKQALLKSGTSFKLTRVNPYFEDQGDYTFEVQLPLAGCVSNQRIFGPVHRSEQRLVPLVGAKYSMRLLAPPLDLSGYAQVTNVTDTEVKVQLVAGRSSFSHAIEDNAEYVDKLSLGNAWDIFPDFDSGDGGWTPGHDTEEQTKIFAYKPKDIDGKVDVETMMHGTYGQTDCVCFPVYALSDSKVVNPHVVQFLAGSSDIANYTKVTYPLALTYVNGEDAEPGSGLPRMDTTLLAPQPYLLDLTRRIIKAVGYDVGSLSEVEATWMRHIFIANTRAVIRREAALPHWTLPDFLKEVQNFLGVVFTVDGRKRVSLRFRKSWYGNSAAMQELKQVSDDLSTDIDKDGENKGSSAGNVDYDWPNDDDMLRLPDEVWENAVVMECASLSAIRTHFNSLKDAEKAKSLYLYKDKATGHTYAILHRKDVPKAYELHRVDQCAPLIRDTDSRDIDTTLKIVPARMILQAYYGAKPTDPGLLEDGEMNNGYPILSVDDTSLATTNYYSVDNAINPKEDTESESTDEGKDVMEVAYYDGSTSYGTTGFPIPTAVSFVTDETTGFREHPTMLTDKSGRLPEDGVFTLGNNAGTIGEALSDGASVDTRAEHLFQFTDRIPGDPMVPYLIRGKRYACHKLEFTIDEHGVRPLKQGYFYEIN